jgi:hypothetical protein
VSAHTDVTRCDDLEARRDDIWFAILRGAPATPDDFRELERCNRALQAAIIDTTPRCIHCNREVRLDQHECYHCQYGALGDVLMDEMLAELDERDEARSNQCPACDGFGTIAGDQIDVPYDCPPEFEELRCLSCNGTGELTEPADEPVIDAQQLDDYLAYQQKSDPFLDSTWE